MNPRIVRCAFPTLLLAAAAALAAPGTGTEFVVAHSTSQQMRIPHLAFHAATDQFLVVWSERGNQQVRGQLVNLDGTASSGDFLIGSGSNERDFPKVAHIANQVYPTQRMSLVVWDDSRTGEDRIWGQLIDASGSALAGSNFQVSTGKAQFPALAYGQTSNAQGTFLVVWNGESGGHAKVFGQLISGATDPNTGSPGAVQGGNFQIADASPGDTLDPSVAYDPLNRQFLVVWADTRGAAGLEYDIWGQRVSSNGTLVGGNFRISSQAGFERAPSIVFHPAALEFLVVWNAGQPTRNVYAQRVSAAGTLQGGIISVAATAADEESLGLTFNPDTGHYVIPLSLDRVKVQVRVLDSAGAAVGGGQQVATDTVASKGRAVAAFGSRQLCAAGAAGLSEVLVVWPDDRAGSSAPYWQDLYGRAVEVSSDKDCDGLLDEWETSGIDIDADGTVDLDLPARGANPNRKDIFLEVDFFDCAVAGGDCAAGDTHTHQPLANAINTAVAAFAAAPTINPDGTRGVTLHVQVDEALRHQNACAFDQTCFDSVKATHLGTVAERASPASAKILAAKRLFYRYNLWTHDQTAGSSVSGIAELPANDFMVSLGSWGACSPGQTDSCNLTVAGAPACAAGSVCRGTGTLNEQTGTFVHELGHTLGLHHGGGDNINCKPNYLSIMTYVWQTTGLQPGNLFTYSDRALPTLNENNLNETPGIQNGVLTTFFGPPANLDGVDQFNDNNWNDDWGTGAGQGPIDWNHSCPTPPVLGCNTQTGVTADINNMGISGCGSSPGQTLDGYQDWDNLQLNPRHTTDYIEGLHQSVPEQREMTVEDARAVEMLRPAAVLVPKNQQLPVDSRGYPVPSSLDWKTIERAAQPTFSTVEIDFDTLAPSPQLALLAPPVDLSQVGKFQWRVRPCGLRRLVALDLSVSGGRARLAPAAGSLLGQCSQHPSFAGNVVSLVAASLEIGLQALRQGGARVVGASALVRSCGGSASIRIAEAGPSGSVKFTAIQPSGSPHVVSLAGTDLASIRIDGQELVVDRVRLTLRCPGSQICARMVADDFMSDGAPVKAVTFWGSYLDPRFTPARLGGVDNDGRDVDGWLLSFHADQPSSGTEPLDYSRPEALLGVYYCPTTVIDIRPTKLTGCQAKRSRIFEYTAGLTDCYPIVVARPDPRDLGSLLAPAPAVGNAFRAVQGRLYWLGIQAVTGITFDPYTLRPRKTANAADRDFWGWLSTPPDQRHDKSVSGCAGVNLSRGLPTEWFFGDWRLLGRGPCLAVDQAFKLTAAEVVPRSR